MNKELEKILFQAQNTIIATGEDRLKLIWEISKSTREENKQSVVIIVNSYDEKQKLKQIAEEDPEPYSANDRRSLYRDRYLSRDRDGNFTIILESCERSYVPLNDNEIDEVGCVIYANALLTAEKLYEDCRFKVELPSDGLGYAPFDETIKQWDGKPLDFRTKMRLLPVLRKLDSYPGMCLWDYVQEKFYLWREHLLMMEITYDCATNELEFYSSFFPREELAFQDKSSIFLVPSIVSLEPFVTMFGLHPENTALYMDGLCELENKVFSLASRTEEEKRLPDGTMGTTNQLTLYKLSKKAHVTVYARKANLEGWSKIQNLCASEEGGGNFQVCTEFSEPPCVSKGLPHLIYLEITPRVGWGLSKMPPCTLRSNLSMQFLLAHLEWYTDAPLGSDGGPALVLLYYDFYNPLLSKYFDPERLTGKIFNEIEQVDPSTCLFPVDYEEFLEAVMEGAPIDYKPDLDNFYVPLMFRVPDGLLQLRKAFDLAMDGQYREAAELLKPICAGAFRPPICPFLNHELCDAYNLYDRLHRNNEPKETDHP